MCMCALIQGKKGFIGPIGDDLPSLLIVIITLTMFFSSIIFAFDLYQQKRENLNINEGALGIAKAFTSKGILTDNDIDKASTNSIVIKKANLVAKSYNLDYGVYFDSQVVPGNEPLECLDSYRFVFMVSRFDSSGKPNLDALILCIKEK